MEIKNDRGRLRGDTGKGEEGSRLKEEIWMGE